MGRNVAAVNQVLRLLFWENGGARCKNALCVFVYVCMCVLSEVMIFEQIVRLWIILSSHFCMVVEGGLDQYIRFLQSIPSSLG
jgi:hypothetical protein